MFQDDRMIPVLSAMVLMVVVGTVLQRADGVGFLFGADPAPGPVLRDDVAEAPGGALLRLDVLANDEGVTPEMRAGLRVVTAPACGRLFVRDGILEYIADKGCEGRQTIRYSVPGAGEGQAATVTARIREGLDPVARRQSPGAIRTPAGAGAGTEPGSADSMERAALAAAGSSEPGRPSVRLAALLPPSPDDPAVAGAPPGAGPAMAAPAGRPAAADPPSGRPVDLAVPAPPVAGMPGGLDDRPAPAPDGAVPHDDPASAGQPAFLLAVIGRGGGGGQGGPAAARSPLTADTRDAGAVPGGRSAAAMGATPRPHPAPAVAALAAPAPAAAPPTSPGRPATPLGIVRAPAAAAPADALRSLADAVIVSAPPDAPPERPGRVPQALPATPPLAPGTRIDPGAYAPDPAAPDPAASRVPAITEHAVPATTDHGRPASIVASVAQAAATRALPPPADSQAGPASPAAAPPAAAPPAAAARGTCVAAPETTVTVHPAAETQIAVSSPCHAGTVAELGYAGLRLAVPLDAAGEGEITALGFAPASTARLAFADGQTLAFDIPFRGVDRVSRVALAWDAPVALALNALEHGASLGAPGHVGPDRPRSFDEVRRAGGGWLMAWEPEGGAGQSVQVYSWYHRSGETPGIVRMLVDFVSRDRDRLPSACGDGADAAPRFTVLRAVAGRPDRPVLRRLAPVDCDRVAAGDDNRLISGAVDDLVITSR